MAAFDEFTNGIGGIVEVEPKVIKPLTKAQRYAAWKKENKGAYSMAYSSCCRCTPTRAEALLVQQYNDITGWNG